MSTRVMKRCANGLPCEEVVARLKAADLAQQVLADREHAIRLRLQAARWAEIHGHGQDSSTGVRSEEVS